MWAKAVKDAKGGAVQFRVEKAGIVHAGVGKASFSHEDAIAAQHVQAFIDAVAKAKPSGAKGHLHQEALLFRPQWALALKIEPSSRRTRKTYRAIIE